MWKISLSWITNARLKLICVVRAFWFSACIFEIFTLNFDIRQIIGIIGVTFPFSLSFVTLGIKIFQGTCQPFRFVLFIVALSWTWIITPPPPYLVRFFISMFEYPGKQKLEVSSTSSKCVSVRHMTLGSDLNPYKKDSKSRTLFLIEWIFIRKKDIIWVGWDLEDLSRDGKGLWRGSRDL